MHTCPECGMQCDCNGDIDDLADVSETDSDNCVHDCQKFQFEYGEEKDLDNYYEFDGW